MIPRDLLKRYNLPEDQAADAIETAISRTLSAMLRMNVLVRLDENLEVIAINQRLADAEPIQIDPTGISKQGQRQIRRQIALELEKRLALHECNHLHSLRGQVIKGEIRKVSTNGEVTVALEVDDHFRQLTLTGVCPARYLPPKERGCFYLGEIRAFLVTSVLSVQKRGRYKVQIRLSRTSKALPELLLRQTTSLQGIRCLKRIAGAFCEIETVKFLPRDAINAVGEELKERIIVRVLESKKNA
ncbi:hypothetical protein [Geopsychrobacter electrodiphilus]|uniref:hypothetical protein n=1 Tax=Geopsychrobacter electrodiphilus TaxID=225196 RepID=UPI00036AC80F|nr:hypothetical protein [Geopsychrobacter electrodiphilus]